MHEVLPPRCLGKQAMGPPVDKVAVRLVEHERDLVLPRERRKLSQQLGRVDGSRRVVGRHEDDGACARGDELCAAGGGGEEGGCGAGERDERDRELLERHGVVEVPRGREDDLVAWLGEGEHGGVEGAAGGEREQVPGQDRRARVAPESTHRLHPAVMTTSSLPTGCAPCRVP